MLWRRTNGEALGARWCDKPAVGSQLSSTAAASMPKSTVKLVSAEGYEFIVDYKAACVSNTIRNMLSSQGAHGLGGSAWPGGKSHRRRVPPKSRQLSHYQLLEVLQQQLVRICMACAFTRQLHTTGGVLRPAGTRRRQLHGNRAGRGQIPRDLDSHP